MSNLSSRIVLLAFSIQVCLAAGSCTSVERQRETEQRLQTTLSELEDSRTRVTDLEARLDQSQESLKAAKDTIALHERANGGGLVGDYQALQRQTTQQTAFLDSLQNELDQARDSIASLKDTLARTEKELVDTCAQREQAMAAIAALKRDTESAAQASSIIEARIDGQFDGWDGETVFKLDNGQAWQQSSYSYVYHYAYYPKVLIYKSGPGYKMKVDGVATEVNVVRLK